MGQSSPPYHLAYVFEKFPSFTQTFCVREIEELERQGIRPVIISIRGTREEALKHFPEKLVDRVCFLPPEKELVEEAVRLKDDRRFPQSVVLTLRHWGDDKGDTRGDKQRVYEAAVIGLMLEEMGGIRHLHSHFAGVGARTCWWMKKFYDFTYSFTGHANDIFCEETHDVTLGNLIRDASLVVTVSDYSVRRLQKRFPSSAAKIRRVYNGMELGTFGAVRNEERWEKEKGVKRILSVGRLIEKKGFDELIAACGLLRKRGAEDFECVIVGNGPLEKELQDQIGREGLEGVVVLAGAREQDEIASLMRKTQLFVLPCVMEKGGGMDNLPTVIMEAMVAGLPCVSTRVAGVPEMVLDGKTGRLVEERDTEGLADAMESLLGDPEKSRALGETGARVASERFDRARTVSQLRAYLVRFGMLPHDPELVRRDPSLRSAYRHQRLRRFARLFRYRRKKVAY